MQPDAGPATMNKTLPIGGSLVHLPGPWELPSASFSSCSKFQLPLDSSFVSPFVNSARFACVVFACSGHRLDENVKLCSILSVLSLHYSNFSLHDSNNESALLPDA